MFISEREEQPLKAPVSIFSRDCDKFISEREEQPSNRYGPILFTLSPSVTVVNPV